MDSRVREQISRMQSAPDNSADGWLPPLTELVIALPRRLARAAAAAVRPHSSQPGRDGIDVPPMSSEWLQEITAECGKHEQQL